MTVNFETEAEPAFSFPYEELARQVIEAAADREDFPYEAEVGLTLTDNASIRRINADFRGIDCATDVLSFPMLSCDAPGDFSCIEREGDTCVNPDTGEVLLGDIVISVEKVAEQAKAYGHSERREYAFLITHSMLHLFGYDHMQPEEAAVMEEHQRMILDELGIFR